MFLFGKGKVNKQISDLTGRYNILKNSSISANMEKLKIISINNAEYKELYTVIEANYNSLINDFYLEIEESINSLENSKNLMDLKLIKTEVKNISDKLDKAEYEKNEINNQISMMFEKENKIREELTPLKEVYREFVSDYNKLKLDLDKCAYVFEETIVELDNHINDIERYLTTGQYVEAEEVFNNFKEKLLSYVKHLKMMPEMINFVFKVLPSRYNAVVELYEQMKNEGYVLFSIKMATYQDEIEKLFEEIKQRFYELRYLETKDKMKLLTLKINEINVKLTQEKEAKENFDDNNDKVYAFIDEINKRSLKAKRDFYSVNGVYLIDKSKEDELIFIENELHALSRIKMELETYIHSPTKHPYSTLNTKLMELKDFSDSINTKVELFQSYIYSLKEDSQYAYKYINDASIALTYYYDLLLSLNHKVLSIMYKERYEEVTNFIDVISKELITKPIYVEKINEELKIFKSKATSLLQEMKDSCKLHNNATNIIVYTNKYRSSFSAVNDVLNRAQIHFDNGEFEFAIDSVSEILQQVHPQAYEEMVRYKEENNE